MPDLSTAPEPSDASYSNSADDRDPFENDAMVGKTLDGRYRIVRVLGMGGAGVVYEARQLELGHRVAIKLLRETYGDSDIARRRFRREAKLLSELAHPNIVRLTDYGVSDGCPYLVMEYLEGESLEQRLRKGPLVPEDGLCLMRDVIRALAFAHTRRVLHRDLKPGNILLQDLGDGELHPKLLDFGLARLFADDVPESSTRTLPANLEDDAITGDDSGDDLEDSFEPALTRRGAILGTPTYMAPEQGSGEEVGPAADVYAAGVVLFEVLAGQVPFAAPRRSDLLQQHLVGKIPDPRKFRTDLRLDPTLHALIRRCLAKQPKNRYPTAAELQADLDALPARAAWSVIQVGDAKTTKAPVPWRERMPMTVTAALVAVALLALMSLALVLNREPQSSSEQTPPSPLPSAQTHPEQPHVPAAVIPSNPPLALGDNEPAETDHGFDAILDRLSSHDSLDRAAHRDMRVYQRQHPNDPRPTLSLAHDLALHSAWSGAVERYALALRRWPNAVQDEHMLGDLLDAIERTGTSGTAAELVVEFFPECLPEVTRRRAESEHRPTRRILQSLQRRLR